VTSILTAAPSPQATATATPAALPSSPPPVRPEHYTLFTALYLEEIALLETADVLEASRPCPA
jgi:hypothetical protein